MSEVPDSQAGRVDDDPIKDGLTRRINSSASPSRTINELHAASLRARASTKRLNTILSRAPRIRRITRVALQKAFGVNLEALPGKVPMQEGQVCSLPDLIEASLRLLASEPDDDGVAPCTLDDTSQAALLDALGEWNHAQLDEAQADYWTGLAGDSWLSRQARWREVYSEWLADQALLAHGVLELSDHGVEMVQGILDAPTLAARQQAGGFWGGLQVSPLFWPAKGAVRVLLGGALHIYQDEGRSHQRQVIVLPGLAQVFHEFGSLISLQEQLPRLINRHLEAVWPRLPLSRRHELPDVVSQDAVPLTVQPPQPLTDNALHHSADSVVRVQWENERDCVRQINLVLVFPRDAARGSEGSIIQRLQRVEQERKQWIQPRPDIHAALEQMLEWDRLRRLQHIDFASLDSDLAIKTREAKLLRYEKALSGLLDPTDLNHETSAHSDFQALHRQWQEAFAAAQTLVSDSRLADLEYWKYSPAGQRSRASQLLKACHTALDAEVRLQHQLKLIGPRHLKVGLEALEKKPATADARSTTRWLGVSIGSGHRLLGAWVITTAEAVARPIRQEPVLFYLPGIHGGLQGFNSLEQLSAALDASLKGADGSPLWRSVHRPKRARAMAEVNALATDQPLTVTWSVIEGHALMLAIREQLEGFNQLRVSVEKGEQIFREVSDTFLAKMLLADEAASSLQIPPNDTRDQALANVEVLRLAAAQVKRLPAWMAQAAVAQRRQYGRLQTQALSARQALERGLLHQLPALATFARQALIAQLTADGFYPEVNIDQSMLELPDDVSTHWEGHPQRPAGGSGIKTVVSQQRSQFSLLQLALSNLDAEAPWTRQRLRHARYLEPSWKTRLTPDYLLETISALDLGGQYDHQISQAFYGDGEGSTGLRAVLLRAFRLAARWELFSAVNAGLSARAQSLFDVALSARSVSDLERNGHRVQLCCVRLEALTLPQPRHVAGIVVILDQVDGRCLVYWPEATGHPALTEHLNLARARQALIDLAAEPDICLDIARKIAPGWEAQALGSYPEVLHRVAEPLSWLRVIHGFASNGWPGIARAVRRWFMTWRVQPAKALTEIEAEISEQQAAAPRQWLGITLSNGYHLLAMVAHARVLGVQRQARSESNSREELQAYREWRLGEQVDARRRGLLSYVPGVGLGVKVYEVLLAARRVYQRASPHAVFDLVSSVHMAVVEALMTLSPGILARGSRGLSTATLRQALKQLHRQQRMAHGGDFYLRSSPGARSLKGLDGYSTSTTVDGAIALRGHSKGSYVKGGEQFVVDGAERYAVYRRPGERDLRMKNTKVGGENELVLRIQEPSEWLLGADAPEPTPGPSSGRWRPWDTTEGNTGWSAPQAPPRTGYRDRAVLADHAWQGWGQEVPAEPPQAISESKRLYRMPGPRPYDALLLGNKYYEILPAGAKAPDDLVFVRRSVRMGEGSYDELVHWLSDDLASQPIPFTLGADGLWTPRQPLFVGPLVESVATAFPGLTRSSQYAVAHRLVELADTGNSMTATRLLNIRATLDDWLPPVPRVLGQTDDLLRMLKPLRLEKRASINIATESTGMGFARVDFIVPFRLPPALSGPKGTASTHTKNLTVRKAVRQVLERQGFTVTAVEKRKMGNQYNFICTHPKSSNVYFMMTRWTESSSLNIQSTDVLQLSDTWFRRTLTHSPASKKGLYEPVKQAMKDKRLVKMLVGIQHNRSAGYFTVFMIKVTD
ncbi:hypothetical protein K7402_14380 [Pseudomonas fluorescens group sp.]|nr:MULTISPECIES: DUF6543 domain-containing protein [Pseudomonas fluorescens group]MBZ6455306.1 hypothetical protein [Pseudomonas fluorescens group sp.]MBZ6465537.1 hypothetical protein [Pseudomonas fluorescens group sp.]MBZ6468584.1 hypothetical protein [Pseudomonas fluorescens group sp.]WQD70676.1 hypothetical protein U0037_21860 [Pseudomonas marginalis]